MKKIVLLVSAFVGLVGFAQAQNSTCKNPCDKIKTVEEGAFIGVRVANGPNNQNAKISWVLPNTSAVKYSLEIGDIIKKVDGKIILSANDLVNLIATHNPGDVVKITYLHNEKEITKNLKLGAKKTTYITEKGCCDEPNFIGSSIDKVSNLTVSPNPATDQIVIASNIALTGELTINITDILGKVIYTSKITNNEGMLYMPLEIKEIPNGQYLVQVQGSNQVFTQKLVVNK